MAFTDFYSAGAVCSPTRASIMTGKSPARTGITNYLIAPTKDPEHVTSHMELSEFPIAEAFLENGYETGFVGKWHLGYELKHGREIRGSKPPLGGNLKECLGDSLSG
jgi:arylsulfatase A-like enzyme